MNRFQRGIKVFITVGLAAVALGAIAASSAFAEEYEYVPAEFSNSKLKVTTTGLTIKKNGLEPKTCTFKGTTEGSTVAEEFSIVNNFEGDTRFLCPTISTQLQMIVHGDARYDTDHSRYVLDIHEYRTQTLLSPYGTYWEEGGLEGVWVNGSGSTASTLTFSGQIFGQTTSGQVLTISGTVKFTTPSGGLLTLSH